MKLFEKSKGYNQLANTSNPYQGDRKRVLCVCSAGLLRSTSIASFLSNKFGYNVRNCGTSQEYALIPLSEALLYWAEEIHVVKEKERIINMSLSELGLEDTKVVVLDIPDIYPAFDPELMEIIEQFYTSGGYNYD